MSLGFIPVILSVLLGELVPKDLAIYIGTLTGVAFSVFNYYKSPQMLPNFVLYIVTIIMAVFSLISLFKISLWPNNSLSITLEISTIIILFLIYTQKKRLMNYFRKKAVANDKHHYIEAAESSIVSIRIALLFAFIHFAILTISILFVHSMGKEVLWVLQVLLSLLVFVSCIVFNQMAIRFFNKAMSETEFVPIIDDKSDVIGRIVKEDITKQDKDVMIPVIRISIEYQGMVFLSRNNRLNMTEREETDTPLEDYILYKENVDDALKRVLLWAFPAYDELEPRFSIKYKFTNDKQKRLVYMFILHLDDDSILSDKRFVGGKLWTLRQIEDNLDKGFFSEYFEHEFDHLKDIIEIREKYMGS